MTQRDISSDPYAGGEYEDDIFVSYSHGYATESDGQSDLKSWTHSLIKGLPEHVHYSLANQDHPVKIWYDEKLSGNVPLTDSLKQKVEGAALLLIVMTRDYLNSEWCMKERDWFENEIIRRGGDLQNVFVVRAMATDNEGWPDFLKDGYGETVLGFPFCIESIGNDARPYGWVNPTKSETEAEFNIARTELASEIAKKLDQIRQNSSRVQPSFGGKESATRSDKSEWRVLVTPGTEDVQPFVNDLRSSLANEGCIVLPEQSIELNEFNESIEFDALRNARVCVQTIGMTAAKQGDDEVGKVQLHCDRARSQNLRQFFSRRESLPLDVLDHDPVYQAFVKSLGNIPDSVAEDITASVVDYFQSEIDSSTDQPIKAYMQIPANALEKFENLKEEIHAPDCVLFPRQAPTAGSVNDISAERKSLPLIYRECHLVLMLYCIGDHLPWLSKALFKFEQVLAAVGRETSQVPEPVVIDYIGGEAEDLAQHLGVKHISWVSGSDPQILWDQLRDMTS